jgi:hypothetical protein
MQLFDLIHSQVIHKRCSSLDLEPIDGPQLTFQEQPYGSSSFVTEKRTI